MTTNENPKTAARASALASTRFVRASRTSMEKVAADCDCPLELVETLYASELTILEGEARIQTFVPVVALRRVREALRRGMLAQGR